MTHAFPTRRSSDLDPLRRARQHRPGLGADRAVQAARDGPAEEGRLRRIAGHRLGAELLDGRSGLVRPPSAPAPGPVRPALFMSMTTMDFPAYPFTPRRFELRHGIAMSYLARKSTRLNSRHYCASRIP